MIASRRTTTETPTPRDGSANSGRSGRMLSLRPTKTPRGRRAPRRERVPATGPGPVSRSARHPPEASDGDRRHSNAVPATRVRTVVPGVRRRGPGRPVRTSSGTSDHGTRCDRRAGRRCAAILVTSVPGLPTRMKQTPGSRCVSPSSRRVPHPSNGGRRPTTAPDRGPCTCCGVVTAGCSTRTGLAGAMRAWRLIAGRRDVMWPAGAMRAWRLIAGRRDVMGPAGAMRAWRLIAARRDPMAPGGAMRACCLTVARRDPMAPGGAMRAWRLIAGRRDAMGPAGAMRACCLTVARRDRMAPALATKNLRGESGQSRVPSRGGPGLRPAVTGPATGTGLIGPVGCRAGSKHPARRWPMGRDPAQTRGLASAQRRASACLASGTPGRPGRM
jgi:hypothetical protein